MQCLGRSCRRRRCHQEAAAAISSSCGPRWAPHDRCSGSFACLGAIPWGNVRHGHRQGGDAAAAIGDAALGPRNPPQDRLDQRIASLPSAPANGICQNVHDPPHGRTEQEEDDPSRRRRRQSSGSAPGIFHVLAQRDGPEAAGVCGHGTRSIVVLTFLIVISGIGASTLRIRWFLSLRTFFWTRPKEMDVSPC